MANRKFEIVEDEEGVVIYDESDDYDPGEDETEEGFRLMTNEEIFTDEYMQEYARRMDAKIAVEKRNDRLVSAAVILGTILVVSLITIICFNRVL